MDLATGIWIGAALFALLLVPYLVWEIRAARRVATHGSRGSKSAATAISDPIWAAFPTRNRVETKRRALGAKCPAGGRARGPRHAFSSVVGWKLTQRNGSGALCSLLVVSNHVWNSSAVCTVTNPAHPCVA